MFNASEFLDLAGSSDNARALFIAAFGLPSYQHVDGAALEKAIDEAQIMASFNSGEFVTILDRCVNRYDFQRDTVIKVNNEGKFIVRDGGSFGVNDSEGKLSENMQVVSILKDAELSEFDNALFLKALIASI